MSINYRAVVMVGLPYAEMEEFFANKAGEDQDVDDVINDMDFEIQGPYFDCPYEESLVGYTIYQTDDYAWTELVSDQNEIIEAHDKFFAKTGLYPKTYLTPVGW